MSAQLSFNRQSQNKQILDALLSGERLTPLKILRLCGSMRASGRIFDLRHGKYDGNEYPIKDDRVKVGKAVVAEYYIERKEQ